MQYLDYRDYLKNQLALKSAGKSSGSHGLRALARRVNVSHAFLSQVLNKKRNLSHETGRRVAEAISLSKNETEVFLTMIALSTTSDSQYRQKQLQRMESLKNQIKVHFLTHDQSTVISEWYHFPVLEFCDTFPKHAHPKAIAHFLGITQSVATSCLERLIRIGLIEKRDGQIFKTKSVIQMESKVANASIRRHHRQMIEKAIASIDAQSTEQRYLTDMTIGIDIADLPKATQMIEEFKLELSKFLNRKKNKNSVYQFCFQAFGLLKESPNENV